MVIKLELVGYGPEYPTIVDEDAIVAVSYNPPGSSPPLVHLSGCSWTVTQECADRVRKILEERGR